MGTTQLPRQILQGFVALMVSGLLLFIFAHRDAYESSHRSDWKSLINRQPAIETLPAPLVSAVPATIIGVQFGHQNHIVNFSSPFVVPAIKKRSPLEEPEESQVVPRPDGYDSLVCTGGSYLREIKDAFDNKRPSRVIDPKQLNNGWSKDFKNDGITEEQLQRRWGAVFRELFGGQGVPPLSKRKPITVIQDKPYETISGDRVDDPLNTFYDVCYFPNQNIIISFSTRSPAGQIEKDNPDMSKDDRNALLPPLNSLSDMLWTVWNTVSVEPKNLRYIARDYITNKETKAAMQYLFLRDLKRDKDIPWPGLEYRGNSDEVKALLATPNGRATAWLLIDHASELKKKDELTNRQLKVNIFYADNKYCMLWDLEAQNPRRRLKREDHMNRHTKYHLKHSSKRLVKRASKEDFDNCKRQGDIAYEQILAALEGCESRVQDYDSAAFANGWTRSQDIKYTPGEVWENAVKQVAGENKVPTSTTSFYVNLEQDKDFTNRLGQPVKLVPNRANFKQWYIPASSAIIASDIRSPLAEVRRRFEFAGETVPSNQEINDKHVPPLARWSDVTWTMWKEKGGGNDLQYIGHDFVANPRTESVMDYIFEQAGKGDNPPEFPGLEFGMDSAEGRALLGTPNGIGAARILIDRATQLGRRDIRIHIFHSEPDSPCLFINMKPVQAQTQALIKRQVESSRPEPLAMRHEKSKRYKKSFRSLPRTLTPRQKIRLNSRSREKRSDKFSQPEFLFLVNQYGKDARSRHLGLSERYTRTLEAQHNAPIERSDKLFQSFLYGHDDDLLQRDAASYYDTALHTGRAMWAKVVAAFDGHGDPVKDFQPSALDNCWSKDDQPHTLDPHWHLYFDKQLGPAKDIMSRQVSPSLECCAALTWEQDYSSTEEASTPIHHAYYIPSISAIVVNNTVSSTNVIKTLFTETDHQIPSNKEISTNNIPLLARWSDITWTVYRDIANQQCKNPKALRFIAHDFIINRATQIVMAYIFQRKRNSVDVPFPGLEFGMDCEEGLALLGTPDGMGTGWLMQDRWKEMGRRVPKVRIWMEGGRGMMGWDMVAA
ncbi:MAG: hypothetical protein Q9209_005757 [Squamulea sp. 1 TL-2023]